MTRANFGGGAADFLAVIGAGNTLRPSPGTLTFWDAEEGGTQHTDLLLDGVPTSTIAVGSDGQVPTFQGPDGVGSMWADAGFGRVRLLSDKTGEELASDEFIATQVTTPASATATALSGLFVQQIGPGTPDDTARINAALEACRVAGGGVVRGRAGAEYKISDRLVIGSNTTLDFADSQVTLLPGSDSNIVTTHAKANPVATATDGVSTAGSDIVTTSLASVAQVGQTLLVTGAGSSLLASPGQTVPAVLTGVVAAVNTATDQITLRHLSGEPCRAGITTSGAAVKLVNRDRNIDIRIGFMERGANSGTTAFDTNSLFLRHIDGLRLDLRGAHSTGGKYTVAIGDVSDYWIRATGLDVHSDGVHLTAAYDGHVELIEGKAGEDFLSVTCNDFTCNSDISGPVDGLTIGNLRPRRNSVGNMLLLYPQSGGVIKNVKVLGLIDGTGTHPVTVGGFSDYDLGTLDNIDLGTIIRRRQNAYPPGKGGMLLLGTGTFGIVKATVINDPDQATSAGAACVDFGSSVSAGGAPVADYKHLDLTIVMGQYAQFGFMANNANFAFAKVDRLTLRGYSVQAAGNFSILGRGTFEKVEYEGVVWKAGNLRLNTIGTAAKNITVRGARVHMAAGSPFGIFYTNGTAAIETFQFDNCYWTFADASAGYPIQLASGTLGTLIFRGGQYVGARAMVHGQAGNTVGGFNTVFDGCVVSGSRLCDFAAAGAMRVHLTGLVLTSMSAQPINLATATVTVTGHAPLITSPAAFVSRAGSEVVRINAPGVKADPAILTPQNGDRCLTTAGAVANEEAIYEANAAAWLPLRGSVRTGTATLAGGTVTVPNGAITANSVIRVAHKTIGGTPGALYVSAKAAATSFTIASTSAADASVVRYEIVSY